MGRVPQHPTTTDPTPGTLWHAMQLWLDELRRAAAEQSPLEDGTRDFGRKYHEVMEDSTASERLKFYGPQDLANAWTAEEAVALIRERSAESYIGSLDDALEIHNALAFEEHGIFPNALTQDERGDLAVAARKLRGQIATFFSEIDTSNLDACLTGFGYEYAEDLLALVSRHDVAKKVGGQTLFDALLRARMPLAVMLSNRQFVKQHDRRLRDALLADPRNGELLVGSRLVRDPSSSYVLPTSFSGAEWQQLLSAYIDSESPHPNHLEAIAQAHDNENLGITPKIRLQAKKRCDALMQELFADGKNVLVKNGYGVKIDPEQREPVSDQIEHEEGETTHIRSLSEKYLLSTMEPKRVLTNFASLVGYMDRSGLLTMPSFPEQIGAIQRLFVSGKDTYPKGQMFKYLDSLTLLGTHAYIEFLRRNRVEVEEVVAWFFREHLANDFGAENFYYTPSSPNSSFLERCRHIGAEMESVVRQFTLYCDEGGLDLDLLRMTSAPRPWRQIPSLVDRKYLERCQNGDCDRALHLLFSDQSRLTYVYQSLRSRSFTELVTQNRLLYEDLHHFQKDPVDWLISEGLVAVVDDVVEFANPTVILVLSDVNEHEAAAFGHYGPDESTAGLALVDKGWLKFSATLLTSAEASYFNYMLNRSEFSDGPDLRNRYSHGTNADPNDFAAHRTAYVQFIRLLVALTLKIRDDFEVSVPSPSS